MGVVKRSPQALILSIISISATMYLLSVWLPCSVVDIKEMQNERF